MNQKKLALSFRGGGTKTIAYIGFLKALEENNIKPNYIIGSSGGAIAGILYSLGYSFERIIETYKNFSVRNFFAIRKLLFGQILDNKSTRKYIVEALDGEHDFSEAKIPFFIQAINLSTRKAEVFSEGSMVDALLCTITIPLLYKPVFYQGSYYVDGDYGAGFGTEYLRSKGAQVIIGLAAHTEPKDLTSPNIVQGFKYSLSMLFKNFHALDAEASNLDLYFSDLGADIDTIYDAKKSFQLLEVGYNQAMLKMDEVKKLLF